MAYLLDTNVFINAKNNYYGFDYCPAFWDRLTLMNTVGTVLSIEKVSDEIMVVKDSLAEWTANQSKSFFIKPMPDFTTWMNQVLDWTMYQGFDSDTISEFGESADCYLIAQALADGHTVVTLEKPDNSRKRFKIPNVCIGLGIDCLTPFEMLINEKARFVLELPP